MVSTSMSRFMVMVWARCEIGLTHLFPTGVSCLSQDVVEKNLLPSLGCVGACGEHQMMASLGSISGLFNLFPELSGDSHSRMTLFWSLALYRMSGNQAAGSLLTPHHPRTCFEKEEQTTNILRVHTF